MSYCVNCGVELDPSLTVCPLCNTPVINMKGLQKQQAAISPFPKEKASVEPVNTEDWSILLSTILISTSVTCGLLNFLVFTGPLWSIPIIGICALLWVFSIPFLIYTKLPMYLSFLLDGFITGAYLYMFTLLTKGDQWFWKIGLPIVILVTILVEVFWGLYKNLSSSFLATAFYFFAEVGVLCTGIEILLDRYFHGSISLTWSAVTLTVCIIICAALATILSRKRLRNSVRRRLHF